MEGNGGAENGPALVEGTWHAWVPDDSCPCGYCGAEAHGRTESALNAKLDGG